MARILGIDTSCDDTSAAVVDDRMTILSNVVASQVEVHHRYGGVVPELACRKHIEAIGPVYQAALDEAGVTLADLEAIAVTRGPGLSAPCSSGSPLRSRSPMPAVSRSSR